MRFWDRYFVDLRGWKRKATQDYERAKFWELACGRHASDTRDMPKISPRRWPVFGLGFE